MGVDLGVPSTHPAGPQALRTPPPPSGCQVPSPCGDPRVGESLPHPAMDLGAWQLPGAPNPPLRWTQASSTTTPAPPPPAYGWTQPLGAAVGGPRRPGAGYPLTGGATIKGPTGRPVPVPSTAMGAAVLPLLLGLLLLPSAPTHAQM